MNDSTGPDHDRQVPTSTGRRGWVGIDRAWLTDDRLSSTDIHLMMWLDSHTEEYLAALHIKRSADELGWSRNRVIRSIVALESLGLISTEVVPYGDGKRTRFTLHQTEWSDRGRAPKRNAPVSRNGTHPVLQNGTPTISTSIDLGEHLQDNAPSQAIVPDPTIDFEKFWAIYERTGPKKKARECWNRAITKAPSENILAGLIDWMAYWNTPGAASMKWPQGWLNEERWNDTPPAVKRPTATAAERRLANNQDVLGKRGGTVPDIFDIASIGADDQLAIDSPPDYGRDIIDI